MSGTRRGAIACQSWLHSVRVRPFHVGDDSCTALRAVRTVTRRTHRVLYHASVVVVRRRGVAKHKKRVVGVRLSLSRPFPPEGRWPPDWELASGLRGRFGGLIQVTQVPDVAMLMPSAAYRV